jgi:hypothetical protein
MTALTLQLLHISDCETAVERGYYDWGRGRPADSPEPDWDAASPGQRRQTVLRGYGLYDGLPAQRGNRLGPLEVYASTGINSRVVLLDAVRFLLRADQAEPLLARISDETLLEHGTDEQIAAAGDLIDLFDDAYQLGRGKVTKVLYLKRPGFIPVIDSVVGDFLWKNFPFLLRQSSSSRVVLQVYQLLLQTQAGALHSIRAGLAERGFRVSAARLLSYLVWLGWRGHVDAYGFGRSLQTEWQAGSVAEARAKVQEMWRRQLEERATQANYWLVASK